METTVEITLTVTAWVKADAERCDYGVRGSPVWYEASNAELHGLEIEGLEVSIDSLPKDVRELIEEKAVEAALEKDEWE